MDYEIDKQSNSHQLKFALNNEDIINIRPDSIISKTASIRVKKSKSDSILRYFSTSGKNFPVKSVTSKNKRGFVTISPPLPGEIVAINSDEKDVKISTLFFIGYCGDEYNVKITDGVLNKNENVATMVLSESDKPIFLYGFNGIKTINLDAQQQTKVKREYLIGLEGDISHTIDKEFVKIVGPGVVYLHASSPFVMIDTFEKLGN